jgi:hypothetical protein
VQCCSADDMWGYIPKRAPDRTEIGSFHKSRFLPAFHDQVESSVIQIAPKGSPTRKMRMVTKCVVFGLTVAAALYFWGGKRVVFSGGTQYGISRRERHEFAVVEYRYRPITIWRFVVQGTRSAHAQYTFGATQIQTTPRGEWCGNGLGVVIEAVVRYDYGESRLTRVFYDFSTRSLLTTLDDQATDDQATDAQIAAAVEHCNVE